MSKTDLLVMAFVAGSIPIQAATFTVTTTNHSDAGSLRQAILDANANPGPDQIAFNIASAGKTIIPTNALPAVTEAATIDGTTQPGYSNAPIVEINGQSAGTGTDGLRLWAGATTIRGLVINRFNGHGIAIATNGNNIIEGCFIGLNALGTTDQGNNGHGLVVSDAPNNVVGGIFSTQRNVISGNTLSGVFVLGVNATNNSVLGNYIGLNRAGSGAIGNSASGVLLSNAPMNTIGGTVAGARNLISGNGQSGVRIENTNASGNSVQGNFIGLDVTGTTNRPNAAQGVYLLNAPSNTVGGASASARNVVAGNSGAGVRLEGNAARGNRVQGNFIGTRPSGDATAGNSSHGVHFFTTAAHGNLVGGTNSGEANVIAFNFGDGIYVQAGTNNVIRANAIFLNTGLGIDLGNDGVQAQDSGDADTGANELQNYPFLSNAAFSGSGVTINGSLNSRPSRSYALDFFASVLPDVTNGEGQVYLGSTNVTTGADSNVNFSVTLPLVPAGRWISATATDTNGNTSEFSVSVRAETTLAAQTFTVVNTNDSGPGSLRQALTQVNNTPAVASHRVHFAIPGSGTRTIGVLSDLPTMVEPVVIDGFSQAGSSSNTLATGNNAVWLIRLDGNNAGAVDDGLRLLSSSNVVRGLMITRFLGDGIELGIGPNHVSRNNVIVGNCIGLDENGADQGNGANGVFVSDSPGNRIGGASPADRNVISGNAVNGVEINGPGAAQNRVLGNYIGPDPNGTLDRRNGANGVFVSSAAHTTIGGTATGEGNLLVRNLSDGVEINGVNATNNVVLGNYIGTDSSGTNLANIGAGIFLTSNARFNVIGATNSGAGNRIAFNFTDGIYVQSGTNNAIRGNHIWINGTLGIDLDNDGITVNDPGDPDVNNANFRQNFPVITNAVLSVGNTLIEGTLNSRPGATYFLDLFASFARDATTTNGEGQVYLGSTTVTTGPNSNAVFSVNLPLTAAGGRWVTATATDTNGNTSEFSTAFFGTTLLPGQTFTVINTNNSGPGSLREAIALNNLTFNAAPNLITFAIPGASPHTISPTNALPAVTMPAIIDGYSQSGASSNTLANGNNAVLRVRLDGASITAFGTDGLTLTGPGNTVRGLAITRFSGEAIELGAGGYNSIQGNFLGLDPDGVTVRSNSSDGIRVNNSPGNTIGGVMPGARNLISGNLSDGIEFTGAAATNNVVLGNFIGTDAGGTLDLGNSGYGINLGFDTPNNTIGGSSPGAGNLISGNNFGGLNVPSRGNVIQGNFIGSDVSGTLGIANNGDGVFVSISGPGTGGNLIGGTDTGAGNLIAFNNQFGVRIGFGTNNAIRGNTIWSNLNVGITLGFGVTPNDAGDGDSGANDLQNFPLITSATVTASDTTVQGSLNSRPNTTYQIDLFANVFADPSGNGEGQQFLGRTSLSTGADGNGPFNVTLAVAAIGGKITATATDPFGNTSEFSPAFTASSDLPSQTFTVINTNDAGPGSLRDAIAAHNATANSGNNTIAFNVSGPGPHFIAPLTPLPAISRPVIIDGFTQGGAASNTLTTGNNAVLKIVLVGTNTGTTASGLSFTSSSNMVRGLHLVGFRAGSIGLTTPGNVIEGNVIGLRPDSSAQANTHGIVVNSAFNRIGGTTPAARNVISGNNGSGVFINGTSATNNVVQGNFLGTDLPGTTARLNSQGGVATFSSGTLLGGSVAGAGNVLADGMSVQLPANHTTIKGNRFGLTFNDTSITNGLGGINVASGVVVIGGTIATERNVICGGGVIVGGLAATNTTIIGNYLGTDSTGTLDRGGAGITINASNTRVGGTAAGEGNIIAFGSGVSVQSGTNCPIRLNRIFGSIGLGINLGFDGVTTNDVADVDAGPNNLQNYPELTNAVANVGNVVVQGRLNSQANTVFQLDFFLNETPDPSGHGEGQYYLGSTNVTTDGSGNASFSVVVPPLLVNARHISATATDPNGNTSEFSPWIVASSTIPPATFTVINTNDSGAGSLRQALLDVNLLPAAGNDVIQFAIPGFGVRTIAPLTPLPTPLDPVTIDGYTQINSSANTLMNGFNTSLLIRLDGTNMQFFNATGLDLTSGNNVIRGLEITRFPGAAIDLNSGSSNFISGCLIWSNGAGVASSGGSGNIIGDQTPSARNVISGNGGSGIGLEGNIGSVIQGNFIGTDLTGTAPLGNGTGVSLTGGTNNLIGPASRGAGMMRNVISGNAGPGILLGNGFAVPVGTRVFGNFIGTDVTGTVGVSNQFHGIAVNGAIGTTIGGTNENEPNLIAFNLGQGIQIIGNGATNNNIQANSITDNSANARFGISGLGIDLNGDGVTPNDPGDADGSPNHFQNFPVLTSANLTTSNVIVQGTLNSRPSTTYRIDIFVNVECDPLNHGEGKHFLGSTTVTTGTDGNGAFTVNLPVPPEGQLFTATATDPNGNTSEFSSCRQMASLIPPITLVVTNTAHSGPGTLRQAILDNNATFHSGPNRIVFNIAGGGIKTIMPLTRLPDITRPVIIDGFTQPGSSPATDGNNPVWLIRLDGSNAGTNTFVDGLDFEGTSSNGVRGLCIVNFAGNGIEVDGGGDSVIEENLIGIDVLGLASGGSGPQPAGGGPIVSYIGLDGIDVDDSRDNLVRANFVGNARRGINVSGANCISNSVLDNIVGLTPNGDPAPITLTGIRPSNATRTMIKGGRVHNVGASAVGSPQAALSTIVDILSFGSVTGILHDRLLDGISAVSALIPVPFLNSAITSNPTTVQGSLLGAANQVYTLIFYARTNATYSKVFETNVTTAANGLVNFTIVMPSLPVGTFLRATATGPAGTSEDSPDLVVMPPGPYGSANLGITKIDSADPVPLGTNFIYTLTVTNGGPLSATNVIVRDFFPGGLFPTLVTATRGQVVAGNPLSVYVPVLTNGEVAVISITTISFVTTNLYSNFVSVASSMIDPNSGNNTDFELTTILNANDPVFAPLRITRITLTPGVSALIEWSSMTGKTYRLQYNSALTGPWTDLPGDVTATGATASKQDNTLTGMTQRFYRVRLVP